MAGEQIIDLRGDPLSAPKEADIARRGPRRMVKLIPMPGNYAAPAIWTSPFIVENDEKVPCRICVILVTKEPLPEVMRMWVPNDFYEKLPEIPVEW